MELNRSEDDEILNNELKKKKLQQEWSTKLKRRCIST
jgi:hypothetical protein